MLKVILQKDHGPFLGFIFLVQWTTLWIEFNCQAAQPQQGLTFNQSPET